METRPFKPETVVEVVKRMVCPIQPIGDHCVDTDRLENLKNPIEVLGQLPLG